MRGNSISVLVLEQKGLSFFIDPAPLHFDQLLPPNFYLYKIVLFEKCQTENFSRKNGYRKIKSAEN